MGVTKFPNGVGTSDTNYLGNDGSLTLDGTTITAAEIAALGGTGLDATELGYLDGATAGTAVASKAVVLGASKEIATITTATITNVNVGADASAGALTVYPTTTASGTLALACADNTFDGALIITNADHGQATTITIPDSGLATSYLVQSTAALTVAEADILDGATVTTAEVNKLDVSAETETGIAASGTVSASLAITQLDSNAGAGAITLAAPDASMLGKVKVIEMTVAGNALTMALTEVQGGSAATTASFDAVGETLTLVAGTLKWNVIGESGVTLS
jgi:hypothetical protein